MDIDIHHGDVVISSTQKILVKAGGSQSGVTLSHLSAEGATGTVSSSSCAASNGMSMGGGGYTIRNVARCWTYETSLGSQL